MEHRVKQYRLYLLYSGVLLSTLEYVMCVPTIKHCCYRLLLIVIGLI